MLHRSDFNRNRDGRYRAMITAELYLLATMAGVFIALAFVTVWLTSLVNRN